MTITEAAKELKMTRGGIYWMFGHYDFKGHARKEGKRWTFDDEAIDLLKNYRKASLRPFPEEDDKSPATTPSMEAEAKIRVLEAKIRELEEFKRQALGTLNIIDDITNEIGSAHSSQDNTKMNLRVQLDDFKKKTTPAAIRKELDKQDKAEAKARKKAAKAAKAKADFEARETSLFD